MIADYMADAVAECEGLEGLQEPTDDRQYANNVWRGEKVPEEEAKPGVVFVDLPFAEMLKVANLTRFDRLLEVSVTAHGDATHKPIPRLLVNCECGGFIGILVGHAIMVCGNCMATYGLQTGEGDVDVEAHVTATPSTGQVRRFEVPVTQLRLLRPN